MHRLRTFSSPIRGGCQERASDWCTPVHRRPAASSGKKILTQLRRSHTKLSRQGVEGPLAGIIYPRDRVFVGRDPLSNKESAAIIYELRHYAQKRIKLPTQSGVRTRLSGPPGGRASALSGRRAGDRYVTHIPSGARKRTNFGQNRLPAALIAPAPTRCADGQKVAAAYPRYLSVFTGESP